MDKGEWMRAAVARLAEYAKTHSAFTLHDVRAYAESLGLPDLSTPWWGPVALIAKRNGIATITGYEYSDKFRTHGLVARWRSNVFEAAA